MTILAPSVVVNVTSATLELIANSSLTSMFVFSAVNKMSTLTTGFELLLELLELAGALLLLDDGLALLLEELDAEDELDDVGVLVEVLSSEEVSELTLEDSLEFGVKMLELAAGLSQPVTRATATKLSNRLIGFFIMFPLSPRQKPTCLRKTNQAFFIEKRKNLIFYK